MTQKRNSALRRMLERVLPPNVPADTMQGIIIGSLGLGFLVSAIDFTVRYSATYRGMFYWDGRLMDTALMGRWQTLAEAPLTVCDTGHNAHGIAYVAEQIRATPHKELYCVIGFVQIGRAHV